MMQRLRSVVAVALLATAACGSPGDDIDVAGMLAAPPPTTAALPPAPDAASAPAAGSDTADSPAGGQQASGSAGPADDQAETGSESGMTTGGPANGPTPAAGAGGRSTGRGFDGERIVIGVELVAPLAGGAAEIGGKGADTGDTRAQAEAMVDYLNARGGLAGREIVPVYRETNQEASWDAEAQASCAYYTEDNEVFVVVAAVLAISPNLAPCLASRDTPLIVQGRTVLDDADLEALAPYVYLPGRMSATRWAAATVDGLAAEGWLRPAMSLGIVSFDRPQHLRATEDVILPRLAAMGIQVTERIVVSHPGSLTGFGDSSAQIANGILRLRSRGVTHVLMLDDHGILTFLFMPQAESQGWRPAYGLNSLNQGITMAQNAPEGQLPGVTMIGWVTTDDVLDGQDPGGNATKELCLGIMREAGIEYPARVAVASALGYCDAFLFLQHALARAPELSVAGLRAGVDTLGSTYLSPVGLATRFGPGRFDGGAAYRRLVYDAACGCFAYDGTTVAAP